MSIFTPTGAGPFGGAYTKIVDGAAKTAASAEVFLEGLAEDLKFTRSAVYGTASDDLLPIPLVPILSIDDRFAVSPLAFPETGSASVSAS